FHRALELPHQQRLRLRRKLREIIPQPLDGCLAHAPGMHACVVRTAKPSTGHHKSPGVKKSFRKTSGGILGLGAPRASWPALKSCSLSPLAAVEGDNPAIYTPGSTSSARSPPIGALPRVR